MHFSCSILYRGRQNMLEEERKRWMTNETNVASKLGTYPFTLILVFKGLLYFQSDHFMEVFNISWGVFWYFLWTLPCVFVFKYHITLKGSSDPHVVKKKHWYYEHLTDRITALTPGLDHVLAIFDCFLWWRCSGCWVKWSDNPHDSFLLVRFSVLSLSFSYCLF